MEHRPLSTLVCAVTPFASDGSLDEQATRALVQRFGEAGVGTYVGGSSPGEGYALTLTETERLFTIAKDAMAGRAPVRAMGIEPRTVHELLERLRIASSVGLDGVQIYSLDCGHGNRPTATEMERYYRTVLEEITLPTALSSHMAAGYLLPLDLVTTLLADYPHLTGVNCTTFDVGYLTRLLDVCRDRADVHVGGPMQALQALSLGAQGFLSADGNLAPQLCASVIRHFAAGDTAELYACHRQLIGLFRINVWGGSMRWLKAAMQVLELGGHHLRSPYVSLDDAALTSIRRQLVALDLPELSLA